MSSRLRGRRSALATLRGEDIVLESPWASDAWKQPALAPLVQQLTNMRTDVYACGLRDPKPPYAPNRKPARLLMNNPHIAPPPAHRCPSLLTSMIPALRFDCICGGVQHLLYAPGSHIVWPSTAGGAGGLAPP